MVPPQLAPAAGTDGWRGRRPNVDRRRSRPRRTRGPGCVSDDEQVCDRLRPCGIERHVDRLHQGLGTLALVGLGEAGDRPTQGRGGAGRVVPVEAAEAGARDEERLVVVQPPHRGIEGLHPTTKPFLPPGEVERVQRTLVVECLQASRPRDVALGRQASTVERICSVLFAGSSDSTVDAEAGETVREASATPPGVPHHHDAGVPARGRLRWAGSDPAPVAARARARAAAGVHGVQVTDHGGQVQPGAGSAWRGWSRRLRSMRSGRWSRSCRGPSR